jgi:hypothetical protein
MAWVGITLGGRSCDLDLEGGIKEARVLETKAFVTTVNGKRLTLRYSKRLRAELLERGIELKPHEFITTHAKVPRPRKGGRR